MDITTFSALAEPSRLRIVELLHGGPLTVGEIADRLGLRQPQASKHLRVLLEAGLVEVQAVANRRNYYLRSEPFQALDAWLETYRNIWDERLDNLENYLQKLQFKSNNEN
ncbi:ArsR/SmtB family transcription factor [Paenibacillus sp. Soil522]|uniref:ArsR/SmtB family transcription factor n=1 Tax=Paenibacillus sp. Soil522 TaxID=1736388 RepID=UPI0006F8EFF2|nr:metalloregulator ArsR/SmtB family transcription factor [Paenibacillus sp. Soil522]KRE54390.1 TrmB family transcriptional regulator [Paenibacillus sp. Soil522]